MGVLTSDHPAEAADAVARGNQRWQLGFDRRHGAASIPLEVMQRITAMASGGMDDLPHNGAVITVLAVTSLTHRQSYGDILPITLMKTFAVFVVIGVYYATGLV